MAMHQYLADEVVVDFADGLLSRREALRRLTLLGVGVAAATAALAACGGGGDEPGSARSSVAEPTAGPIATSPPTPTPIVTAPATSALSAPTPTDSTRTEPVVTEPPAVPPVAEEIRFAGASGELIAMFADATAPIGAVLIIHENRGLTPHFRALPARLAADRYTAMSIDLLSAEGGTASLGDDGAATAALGAAPPERLISDLRAGLDELERRAPGAKLAVIGFCFGGGMTWRLLAAGEPRLSAAVPFYGPAPADADFTGSQAAVLGIFAERDGRVNASLPTARAALEAAGLMHELLTIADSDHAFFNDTGARYNAAAATQAYTAMLEWFGTHLA